MTLPPSKVLQGSFCNESYFSGCSQKKEKKTTGSSPIQAGAKASNYDLFLENTYWIIECSSQNRSLSKEVKRKIKQIVVNRDYLPCIKDTNGEKSLLKTLFYEHNNFQYHKLLKLLVKNGSDINECDQSGLFKGNTILIWTVANAFYQNAIKLIELGINLGLDLTIADKKEKNTALLLSLKKGFRQDPEGWKKLVTLLIAHTRNIDAKDWEGNTALHVAAFRRETEFVKYLVRSGANTELRNEIGQKAADLWRVDVDDLADENLDRVCGYVNDEDVTFDILERNQRSNLPPEELSVKDSRMNLKNLLNDT